MRISDWSSDVCSSDLDPRCIARDPEGAIGARDLPGFAGAGGFDLVEPRGGAEHLPRGVDFVQGIAVSARLHQQPDPGCAEVGIVGPMVTRAVQRCRELLGATAPPPEFAEGGMWLPPPPDHP